MNARTHRSYACTLTSPSRGAIAVVNVWGVGAVEAVDAIFRPNSGRALAATSQGFPRVGRLGRGAGDEVVAIIVEDPKRVEIQCHGGPAAISLVFEALRGVGVSRVSPLRWLFAGHLGRIEVEATWCLSQAQTLRPATVLLDQLNGALRREIEDIAELLQRGVVSAAIARLRALLSGWELGSRLVRGWRVVLCGRPNVGKSSLLNALLGFERAIVDPSPGTTRDVVACAAAFEGWPVELVDTAGLRDSLDAIESAGIERARSHQASADMRLIVLDGSAPLTIDDRVLLELPGPKIVVANKADLPTAWDPVPTGAVPVSARCGEGIEFLIKQIARSLCEPRPTGAAVPFRRSHIRKLEQVIAALDRNDSADAVRWLKALLGDQP